LADLVDVGLLTPGQVLVWNRPRLGESYVATVTESGGLRLEDGRVCPSPSRAAMDAANVPAYDGWYAWRIDGDDGESLHELRVRCVSALRADEGEERAKDAEETTSEGAAVEQTGVHSHGVPTEG
jgi:hypothetical protein